MSETNLESLVNALVPLARSDESLRNELAAHCGEVLKSHTGQSPEADIAHIADSIKRNLLNASPNGVPTLRFSNLLSRLLEQPVLSRKHASLVFLHTLSTSQASISRTYGALPSLSMPTASRPHQPSRNATPSDTAPASTAPKRKSKAELLREYRAKSGEQDCHIHPTN
ncbi:hypothetical protein BC629DRAFT_1600551 [Irpex lacteus]|nr:hypothetical protein BC629DRAFT_1600551 [Irpex lacteus]